jgi:hypothetical protein
MEIPSAAYNKKYFDRWSYFLTKSPFRRYYQYIARKYEPEFTKYGYSLIKGLMENGEMLGRDSKVSAVLGPMYCLAAEVAALLRRSAVRAKSYLKRVVKKLLPEFALDIIRRARQNALLRQQRAQAALETVNGH